MLSRIYAFILTLVVLAAVGFGCWAIITGKIEIKINDSNKTEEIIDEDEESEENDVTNGYVLVLG